MGNAKIDFVVAAVAAELGVTLEQYREAHRSVARRFEINLDTTVTFHVPDFHKADPESYIAQHLSGLAALPRQETPQQSSGMARRFSSQFNRLSPRDPGFYQQSPDLESRTREETAHTAEISD